MDEDVAGLNDDDNPALEEVDATVEFIENDWPRGPVTIVP